MHPAPMRKIDLLVLDRHLEEVTRGLGRLGVLHLAHAEAGTGADVPPVRPEQRHKVERLILRIERLMVALGIDLDGEHTPVPHTTAADVKQLLGDIEGRQDELRTRVDSINGQLEHLRLTVDKLRKWEVLDSPVSGLSDSSFLHAETGSIFRNRRAEFERVIEPSVVVLDLGRDGERENLMVITSSRGRWALESALADAGFQPMPDELEGEHVHPVAIVRAAITKLHQTEVERDKAERAVTMLADIHRNALLALRERFRVELQVLDAQSYFSSTDATCLISGWVPADGITAVESELLRLTEGLAVLQITDPDEADIPEDQIPIKMRNSTFARPFEVLVSGFGLPGYRQIEPTAVVGVTFLVMFGLMFGDVGQGAVLAIGGWLLSRYGKKAKLRDAGLLVCFAGCSAFAFGFLYGGVFGIPQVIHGHFEPLHRVMAMLVIGVGVGVLVITVGIVLNIINRLRRGDLFHGIFDKFGLVGIVFYLGAIGVGVHGVLTGDFSGPWLIGLVFLPLGVLLMRSPLYRLILRRKPPGHGPGGFSGAIESGAEVMEAISGFLANTISFARVGAFALSHAGLCLAISEMVEMAGDGPMSPVWKVLILIAGNALVIALEGLITTIQIVRLEWYEFFSKFFEAKGRPYHPFHVECETVDIEKDV